MSRLPPEPPSAEITPPELYARRREFLKNTALFAGTAAAVGAVRKKPSSRWRRSMMGMGNGGGDGTRTHDLAVMSRSL